MGGRTTTTITNNNDNNNKSNKNNNDNNNNNSNNNNNNSNNNSNVLLLQDTQFNSLGMSDKFQVVKQVGQAVQVSNEWILNGEKFLIDKNNCIPVGLGKIY